MHASLRLAAGSSCVIDNEIPSTAEEESVDRMHPPPRVGFGRKLGRCA